MRARISLSRFLIVFLMLGAILGIGMRYSRLRQKRAELVARIHAASGSLEEESESYWGLPFGRVVAVDFSGVNKPVASQLFDDLARLGSVRRLWLDERMLDAADIAAVSRITTLEELSLFATGVEDDWVSPLRNLERLRILDLAECQLTEQCLDTIQALRNLQSLSVARTHIDLDRLSSLRLNELRLVDASDCDGVGDMLDLTENGFGGLPRLEALSVRRGGVEMILAGSGIRLPNLRALDLRTTSAGIEGLADVAPNLRQIGLEPKKLSLASLRELSRFQSLETVLISTDIFVLFFDWDRPLDTVTVTINEEEVEVPATIQKEARELLSSLVQSRPGTRVTSTGPLLGQLYEAHVGQSLEGELNRRRKELRTVQRGFLTGDGN